MLRIKSSFHIPWLTLAFLCMFNVGPTLAQNLLKSAGISQEKDSTQKQEIIQPIAIENITVEAQQVFEELRSIQQLLQPSAIEDKINKDLPEFIKKIEILKNDPRLKNIQDLNLRDLEDLKRDIQQYKDQLEKWRNELSDLTATIIPKDNVLKQMRERWEKTKSDHMVEDFPTTIYNRVNSVIAEITKAQSQLEERMESVFVKEDQITSEIIYSDEILQQVQTDMLKYNNQLFAIDSPPIWKSFTAIQGWNESLQLLKETFQNQVKDFQSFKVSYSHVFFYHVLLFIILCILLINFKKRFYTWSKDKIDATLEASIHIINHPLATAALIALLFTTFLYPNAPESVLEWLYFIMIFPILTLLPAIFKNFHQRYLYIFAGFFVINQLIFDFGNFPFFERWLLLLFQVLLIGLFGRIIWRQSHIKTQLQKIKWDFGVTILRVIFALLVISLLANIIGIVIFARFITSACLSTIIAAIILYTSVRVLISLFSMFLKSDKVAQTNLVKTYFENIDRQTKRLIKAGAIIYWIYLVLNMFRIYDPIYGWLSDFLGHEWNIGSLAISLGSIIAFFFTLWFSLFLSKIIRIVLQDEVLTHFDLPRGIPGAISMLVKLALITIGFLMAFGAAGIQIEKITIIFGALSVGIGFGLQNIFNNLVSGLIIAFERPIQIGDTIQLDELLGEVKDIGLRSSIVRTYDGAEVIVPNGNLISNRMINWTLSDRRRRLEILVGVAYGTELKKVLKILNETVTNNPKILKIPQSMILFNGFGDSSLDFRVLFWVHFDEGLSIKSEMGIAIEEAFKKEGIQIPFPQRDLHVKSIDEKIQDAFQSSQFPSTDIKQKVAPKKPKNN